jgi:hypothetical protein
MTRLYQYVGPRELLGRLRDAPLGCAIHSDNDVLRWLGVSDQEPSESGEITVTFVIDEHGVLRIADRRSEHVACAGGRSVLSAGELTFHFTGTDVSVCGATNQSTGYCPEPESWPAVQAALRAANIQSPSSFEPAFHFRYCEVCDSINIIKEDVFECVICMTPVPADWNIDRMREPRPESKSTGKLTSAELREMAKNSPPPQSWYDEDMEGLW